PAQSTALQYYNGALSAAKDPVGNAQYGSAWPQFAISYYQKTGHKVAFVPSAVGGSGMTAAAGTYAGNYPTWDPASPSATLYSTSVSNTRAALSALQAQGYQ